MEIGKKEALQRRVAQMSDSPAKLVMLSARVDESLYESVREMAYHLRRSRQDIIGEALEMFRAKYGGVSPAADTGKQ